MTDSLLRNFKSYSMPLGFIIGALFYRPINELDAHFGGVIIPVLISSMLVVTYCGVSPSQMKLRGLHGWLLAFQLIVSTMLFVSLRSYDLVMAQGVMMCVLTPVAMAAVVIGSILGANVALMATYSLLCNMVIGLVMPIVLTFIGGGDCSYAEIAAHIVPLLIFPFFVAQILRATFKPCVEWVARHGMISFYMWNVAFIFVIARATLFVIDSASHTPFELLIVSAASLMVAITQFSIGRMIGTKYGDKIAGGQLLGQKNTVLAVWICLTFLEPLSSIAPASYIVWQNMINSYQIYKKNQKKCR